MYYFLFFTGEITARYWGFLQGNLTTYSIVYDECNEFKLALAHSVLGNIGHLRDTQEYSEHFPGGCTQRSL